MTLSLLLSFVKPLVKAGLSGAAATIVKVPGITSEGLPAYIIAIRDGNVKSYHTIFCSGLAFGAIAVVCAFCCKEFNSHFTDRVDRKLQHPKKRESETEKQPYQRDPIRHKLAIPHTTYHERKPASGQQAYNF
jgi:phosphotransferase system  glucose/maltose/N-acetylglucosamine-specific IIC component